MEKFNNGSEFFKRACEELPECEEYIQAILSIESIPFDYLKGNL